MACDDVPNTQPCKCVPGGVRDCEPGMPPAPPPSTPPRQGSTPPPTDVPTIGRPLPPPPPPPPHPPHPPLPIPYIRPFPCFPPPLSPPSPVSSLVSVAHHWRCSQPPPGPPSDLAFLGCGCGALPVWGGCLVHPPFVTCKPLGCVTRDACAACRL